MRVHSILGHVLWLGTVAMAVTTSLRSAQADEPAQEPVVDAHSASRWKYVSPIRPSRRARTSLRVKQGERLPVLRREGPWIGVEIRTADGLRRGWVLASSVPR